MRNPLAPLMVAIKARLDSVVTGAEFFFIPEQGQARPHGLFSVAAMEKGTKTTRVWEATVDLRVYGKDPTALDVTGPLDQAVHALTREPLVLDDTWKQRDAAEIAAPITLTQGSDNLSIYGVGQARLSLSVEDLRGGG